MKELFNYTEENISFIKEHIKDFITDNLIIKIKNSKDSTFQGRFYNNFRGKSLIIVRTHKKNKYPLKIKLYERKGLPKSIEVGNRLELIKYVFYHEFKHYLQYLDKEKAKEYDTEYYAICSLKGEKYFNELKRELKE